MTGGGTLLNKPPIRPATASAYRRMLHLRRRAISSLKDAQRGATSAFATHVYDARGLVTSSTDANGNEARFAYDATTGFLAARTIAFGTPQAAIWNFTRSELGWLLSETNPLTHRTTTDYNVNGQPIRVTDPIRTLTKEYNANGSVTAESDAENAFTRYTYNDVEERTQKTDRAGSVWVFGYSPFGELTSTTAPEVLSDGVLRGEIVRRTYDLAGRLVKETDPVGDFSSYEYDTNGNQTAMVDKPGRRWEKAYDSLNRVISERDPEGAPRSAASRRWSRRTATSLPTSMTVAGDC